MPAWHPREPPHAMLQKLLVPCLLLCGASTVQAQETFDVVTFSPPAGWSRELHKGSVLAFTQTNAGDGTFARIAVYLSTKGAGDPASDFAAEWKELVDAQFHTGAASKTRDGLTRNGWASKGGAAAYTFEGKPATITLTTMSKGDRRASILVIASANAFQAEIDRFFASIGLEGGAATARPPAATPEATPSAPNGAPGIVGRWSRSSSSYPSDFKAGSWAGAGYVASRYDFGSDGRYRYTQRSFFLMMPEIVIVKEDGTYTVDGTTLTVSPQSSVVESYAKKNNSDELGTPTSSKIRPPEKVAYRATFDYSTGMKEWNLVLEANHPTVRDGNFQGTSRFPGAWLFNQRFPGDDLTLPKGK
jgi:hypothetical protein